MNIDELQSLIHYDPLTGIITRLKNYNRGKAGKVLGSEHSKGYLETCIKRKRYLIHRLAWFYYYGSLPDGIIDHINGDKKDNRIHNLRVVPWHVNMENQRKASKNNKSTGVFGATKVGNKYVAQIRVLGKQIYLGTFEDADSAGAAYITAKRKLHIGCTI